MALRWRRHGSSQMVSTVKHATTQVKKGEATSNTEQSRAIKAKEKNMKKWYVNGHYEFKTAPSLWVFLSFHNTADHPNYGQTQWNNMPSNRGMDNGKWNGEKHSTASNRESHVSPSGWCRGVSYHRGTPTSSIFGNPMESPIYGNLHHPSPQMMCKGQLEQVRLYSGS